MPDPSVLSPSVLGMLQTALLAVLSGGGLFGLLRWFDSRRVRRDNQTRREEDERGMVRTKLIDDLADFRRMLAERVTKLEGQVELANQRALTESQRAHDAEMKAAAFKVQTDSLAKKLERKDEALKSLTLQIVKLGHVPVNLIDLTAVDNTAPVRIPEGGPK